MSISMLNSTDSFSIWSWTEAEFIKIDYPSCAGDNVPLYLSVGCYLSVGGSVYTWNSYVFYFYYYCIIKSTSNPFIFGDLTVYPILVVGGLGLATHDFINVILLATKLKSGGVFNMLLTFELNPLYPVS